MDIDKHFDKYGEWKKSDIELFNEERGALKKNINLALAEIYEDLIDKSWQNADTFEAYQDAWNVVAGAFRVGEFDWTKGEKPKHGIIS